jgi:Molybdopterin-guanine dinucleotide biosynthesis protein A
MSSLYGLVVCGGKSTRMGIDKSMLDYHGQPQRYHVYDMLLPLCEKVFISCNEEQAGTIPDRYAVIIDKEPYKEIGPMAALLSAFDAYPVASFLAVGCDYPMLTNEHLQNLTKASLHTKNCTASYNILDCIYEPLITVYQNNMKVYLENNFRQNKYSLRVLLEEINADIVIPYKQIQIMSIDNQKDREIIIAQLRNK